MVLGLPVTVAVVVSEITDVCSTVISAGAPPVVVSVTVVGTGAGAIEVLIITSFVEVLRLVFVTGWGSLYAGQKPLQNPYPLCFLSRFAIPS
jgi:hypothetical protein